MKKASDKSYPFVGQEGSAENTNLPGYPLYPSNEDIYSKCKKEKEIDPDDITKIKVNENIGIRNEKDFNEDVSGGDLDVPGSDLDEDMEDIGNEDEENSYYSIGGDGHTDLDENLGT